MWQPSCPPASLEGRHLRLLTGLREATTIHSDAFVGPALVIATEGEVDLIRGGARVRVPRGEPRLVLADGAPFTVQPVDGGLCCVAGVHGRATPSGPDPT